MRAHARVRIEGTFEATFLPRIESRIQVRPPPATPAAGRARLGFRARS